MLMCTQGRHQQNRIERKALLTANENQMPSEESASPCRITAERGNPMPNSYLPLKRAVSLPLFVASRRGGAVLLNMGHATSDMNHGSSSPGLADGITPSVHTSQQTVPHNKCHNDQELFSKEHMTEIVTMLTHNGTMTNLVLSTDVEYVQRGRHFDQALLTNEREHGEEAYTIADVYLRDKFVFIWRIGQCCILRIRLVPKGLLQLPFHQISKVAVKADDAKWVQLQTRIVTDGPTEKELTAVMDPLELHCRRLFSVCPRFGNVDKKYVKILVKIEVRLNEDGTKTVDLYETIYCRVVKRDQRMPFRHLMLRCRRVWADIPQSSRDGAEVACFAIQSIFNSIKSNLE